MPKEDISKRSRGMRILTLVHRKSSTFEILQPFFNPYVHQANTDEDRRKYKVEVDKVLSAKGQCCFSNLRLIEPDDEITKRHYK